MKRRSRVEFERWGFAMKYAFSEFVLDADRAELQRDGNAVHVEPQVFDLLKLLVSSHGRMVSRDEVFAAIWGNQIVSDAALSSRIKDARKALGDDGTTQKFIRTIHRRGLLFVGDVETESPEHASRANAKPAHDVPQVVDTPQQVAIAILPLEDISSEAGSQNFARALTDELTVALTSWRSFLVISRQSVMRLGTQHRSVRDIGAALNADYLLFGTLRRVGNKVKVQVTLSHAGQNVDVWSERLECHLDELVDLEEEIAARIACLVAPELQGAEARQVLSKPPGDWTAWDISMRATALLRSGKRSDLEQAEDLASAACRMSPGWSLPFNLVAIARFQKAMAGFSSADSSQAFSSTLEAAQRALEIDYNSWLAHALTAVGELWTNKHHEKALLHAEKAIELNSSAPMNYHFGGCITGFSGEPTKARAYQERLFRIDPTYPYRAVIEADLGLWHMMDHDYEHAGLHLDRAQVWDPRYGRALQRRIALAGLVGDRDTAQSLAKQLKDMGLPLDVDTIVASYPFKREADAELFQQGLRSAGINI